MGKIELGPFACVSIHEYKDAFILKLQMRRVRPFLYVSFISAISRVYKSIFLSIKKIKSGMDLISELQLYYHYNDHH